MTFSITPFTHHSLELSPTISPFKFLTSEQPTRPALLHLLKASTVMPSTPSLSTLLPRQSWPPDPQTRPSDYGIYETSRRSSTRLKDTLILSSRSLGIRLKSLFWPVLVTIGRSCSGTSAELVRSRLPRMHKMDLLNCTFINHLFFLNPC